MSRNSKEEDKHAIDNMFLSFYFQGMSNEAKIKWLKGK